MLYLIIILGILLIGLVVVFFIGRTFKKCIEEAENSMNEPMYDKRYES
jgi:hypothetical protein